jgi:3-dehydroquinate synthase
VPLGAAAYDILIGAGTLDALPEIVARACPAHRYAVIADSTVARLYGERVTGLLSGPARADLIVFPAGEWNKTREQWHQLSDAMLAAGFGRDGAVVALGGGVTGDLAGFVAATFLRGVPYVQLPTTLLAMIDSSIGGKTGVDTTFGKNLIGVFHQPRAVLADVTTLASLPAPHVAAGVAEALKHGAIADAAYFARLGTLRGAVRAGDRDALIETVAGSVAIKAAVVAEDERESGRRAILNFGHTIAHAIETVTGFTLLHGEAVAIGMALEADLGTRLGITRPGVTETVRDALASWGLPTEVPDVAADDVLEAMQFDKKARSGSVKFAFLESVGAVARGPAGEWTFTAPPDAIRAALTC